MKKIVSFFALLFVVSLSFAQVQRVKSTTVSKDSAAAVAGTQKTVQGERRKDMMKELNLNKEQKSKLKEIKQAHKVQMNEVQNDAKLSPEQKKAKLKALKMEQLKKTMAVLNEEQKAKMKAMRKQNKKEGKEEELMEEQQ